MHYLLAATTGTVTVVNCGKGFSAVRIHQWSVSVCAFSYPVRQHMRIQISFMIYRAFSFVNDVFCVL